MPEAAHSPIDRLLGGRLWRNADFSKLWLGQFVSEAGTQVSALALPSVAILVLKATPFQVGLLGALEFLAFPVLGLVAGVYADRVRRLRIMILCDGVRLFLLASVPVAAIFGVLSMEQLYLVALVAGVCSVFFDISYQSYLPAVIDRADLVEGNTKIEFTRSVAELAGPAVAGFLIQLVGAARSVGVDAASYLVSVVSLLAIRKREADPREGRDPALPTGFLHELWEGVGVVIHNATLWKIAGCTATYNLGWNILFAVYLIYAYRNLHLTPAVVGGIFAVGAAGGLVGALSAGWFSRRIGLGPTLLVSTAAGGVAAFLVPLAAGERAVAVLLVFGVVTTFFGPIYNINQVSLRQAITPDRLQGRMNATMRTIVWGTIPIGSLLGGILGGSIGVVPTLWIGATIATLAGLWILAGPIRLRSQPEPVGA